MDEPNLGGEAVLKLVDLGVVGVLKLVDLGVVGAVGPLSTFLGTPNCIADLDLGVIGSLVDRNGRSPVSTLSVGITGDRSIHAVGWMSGWLGLGANLPTQTCNPANSLQA
jgi:hypothetical protein